jgi:hypothetical protein
MRSTLYRRSKGGYTTETLLFQWRPLGDDNDPVLVRFYTKWKLQPWQPTVYASHLMEIPIGGRDLERVFARNFWNRLISEGWREKHGVKSEDDLIVL